MNTAALLKLCLDMIEQRWDRDSPAAITLKGALLERIEAEEGEAARGLRVMRRVRSFRQ